MLPLSTTWTCEKGLPPEARIPKLWDTTISSSSREFTDTVCSFLPQDGSEGPVSGAGYCVSALLVTNMSDRPEYGSRQRSGPHAGTLGTPRRDYAIVP